MDDRHDHLVAKQDDNPFGMGAHQNHPASGPNPRIDAVAVAESGHDEATEWCWPGPRFLDEPIEGAAKRHQARAFFLEHIPDQPILELQDAWIR